MALVMWNVKQLSDTRGVFYNTAGVPGDSTGVGWASGSRRFGRLFVLAAVFSDHQRKGLSARWFVRERARGHAFADTVSVALNYEYDRVDFL